MFYNFTALTDQRFDMQFHHFLIISLALFFSPKSSITQTNRLLEKSTTDREKSEIYAKMAFDTSRVNIPKAKTYALKSFHLAKKCGDNQLLLRSSKTLGILYKILEDIDSSQHYSIIGIQYADKVPDKRTAAALTTLVALSYVDYGQYSEAYQFFDEAEKRYEDLNREEIDPTYLFFKLNKSSLFNELTLYDQMLAELFEAQRIADSTSDHNFSGQILASIAVAYKNNNDVETSIAYNKKSLKYFRKGEVDQAITFTNIGNNFSEIHEIDSALYYYQKAEDVYTKCNASPASFYKLYTAKAQMYFDNKMSAKAAQLLTTIETEPLKDKDKAQVFLLKSKTSDLPTEKLNYAKEALKYSLLGSDILSQKESHYIIYNELKSGNQYADALDHYESYQVLEDSIFNREKSKAVQKVILQQVMDDKNAEIRMNQLEFAKDKAEKNKAILYIVLALVIALFILVLLYFRYRSQKQKTRIETQSKELLEQENNGIKDELIHVVFESDRNFEFLQGAKKKLKEIKHSSDKDKQISSLSALVNGFVASESEKRNYKDKVEQVKADFFEKVEQNAKLTKTEKKMTALLKLDLSTKEIAAILNVTDSTVEVYRSRLRKKLNIEKDQSLPKFLNNL